VAGWLARRFGPVELASALLLALAAEAGATALARPGPLPASWRAAGAAAACALLALHLRLSDDLKDWEVDRRLAAEGDLRFTARPQVLGAVTQADLRRARLLVSLAYAALLSVQPPATALLGGLAFAGAWLAARWFFWPAMADHLPIAFATHNPIGLLAVGFAAAAGSEAAGASPWSPVTFALALGLYLPVAAWEIARKVRTPAEETGYRTWSSLLGWRAAAAVPALLGAASAMLLAAVAQRAALPGWYRPLLAVALLAPVLAALAVLRAPTPAGAARLRPAVEIYAVAAALGLLAAALAARGLGGMP
jgi:4-hydroxybenzoate polyprenyltransferase